MRTAEEWRKGVASGEHLALSAVMAKSGFITDDEMAVRGGRRIALHFREGGEDVPGILMLPLEPRPAPAALLLHGYSSNKERMSDSAGKSLLALGVATLAIDLPLHGARVRAGSAAGISADEARNPIKLAQRWRAAVKECTGALRHLAELSEVNSDRIAIIGYSMGAYIAVMLAADDPSIRALALAAGGDLPDDLPFAALVRKMVDPIRAIRRYAGRPLLMVNGRNDRTIRPSQAERLYAAAGEPKRILWYDGGHWLPDPAVRQASGWLAEALR